MQRGRLMKFRMTSLFWAGMNPCAGGWMDGGCDRGLTRPAGPLSTVTVTSEAPCVLFRVMAFVSDVCMSATEGANTKQTMLLRRSQPACTYLILLALDCCILRSHTPQRLPRSSALQ